SRAAPPSPCRRAPRPPHRSATTTAPTSPLLCPPSSIEARCQPKRARDVAGRRLQRGKGPARPTARSVTPVPEAWSGLVGVLILLRRLRRGRAVGGAALGSHGRLGVLLDRGRLRRLRLGQIGLRGGELLLQRGDLNLEVVA